MEAKRNFATKNDDDGNDGKKSDLELFEEQKNKKASKAAS